MKVKILVLAVFSAIAAPVAAQSAGNVTIYGTLRVQVESIKATGAAGAGVNQASRIRVIDNDSAIGFRGEEDLGGGLKAFWQLESAARPDGIDGAGVGAPGFITRNSGVGLRGNWGQFMLGRWDVYDNDHEGIADRVGSKAGQAAKSRALFSKFNGTQFSGRLPNVVQYTTPKLGGFTGRLNYSTGPNTELKTATADEKAWGLSLAYSEGPIAAGYSYFKQGDLTNISGLNRSGHKLAGSYLFGGSTRLGLIWERLEAKNYGASFAAGGANNAKRNAWGLTLSHAMGPHTLFGSYGVARDGSGTTGAFGVGANTGAKYLQGTWAYDLSKRTNLHVTYARVANRSAALYDFHSNGAITGMGAGADPVTLQFGLVHSF